MRDLGAAVLLAGLAAGCGHGAAAPGAAPDGPVGVADAAAAAPGTRLLVAARFAGWSGGCPGGPPRSRSDWMLVDDAGRCIYVSGPVPRGLAPPPDTRSRGVAVTVSARRAVADDGRPYLQLDP